MKLRKGADSAAGMRFGIVAATFNEEVTRQLLDACRQELTRRGVAMGDVEVVEVPGAFELPLAARALATTGRFDAVICLGAVIRGETPHFEYISAETSRGIGQAALETGVPVIFGVLTTETEEQARERADPAKFDRGGSAAKSAIEMARVMRKITGEADKLTSGRLTGHRRVRRKR
jgi:6,7-dimethyl-8-ribityllumazine synthase